jgi:Heparinase II/III N-terminus/Heparinase II/III-like protein
VTIALARSPHPLLSDARRATYYPVLEPEYGNPESMRPILDHVFTFNGETHRLPDPIAWRDNPSADLEWQILLHKFYYAPGLGNAYAVTGDTRYLQTWLKLTRSWIAAVDPGFIAADVTGRRIQNWIYAYQYFVILNPRDNVPREFLAQFVASLAEQVNYLFLNLHRKRNHRTLELHALFLAGLVFPDLPGPVVWREWALGALCDNIAEDLLPDGVHCELATDYHHIVLRNFLSVRQLCAANDIRFPAEADHALQRALEFALHVQKPDGVVPAFSDGDARSHRDVLALGAELYGDPHWRYATSNGGVGEPPTALGRTFSASGYCVMRSGWGTREPFTDERYVLFDCGPLGEGNHGHLDLLNAEFAAFGRSLIVDPGRYTYHEGGEYNWRAHFRQTSAHNTIVVDGLNQTRYAAYRQRHKILGPAPHYGSRRFLMQGNTGYVCGTARSVEYNAVHTRHLFFLRGRYWVVVDELHAETPHRYELLFHLSEIAQGKIAIDEVAAQRTIRTPHLIVATDPQESSLRVDEGFVSYHYGVKHAAPVINFCQRAGNARFVTVLVPYGAECPTVSVNFRASASFDVETALAVDVQITESNGHFRDQCRLSVHDASGSRCPSIVSIEHDHGTKVLLGRGHDEFVGAPEGETSW